MKFKMLKVRNSSQDNLSCAMLGCAGPSYATQFSRLHLLDLWLP